MAAEMNLSELATSAADAAVDTVFSSVMSKLDSQVAAAAAGGGPGARLPVSPDASLDPAARAALSGPFGEGEAPEWALHHKHEAEERAARGQGRQKAKLDSERYSRTTALLLRAQQLEDNLKQKAAAGRPDDMDGGFDTLGRRQDPGSPLDGSGGGDYLDDDPDNDSDGGGYSDGDGSSPLTRRGAEHLGRRQRFNGAVINTTESEAQDIDDAMRHAERAKRNVRRYKMEAEARRRRRNMVAAAEAEALAAQIRRTEERRKLAMESAEEAKARQLRERVEKSRRARAERNRRREELFAAEKRVRHIKPKPLHERMKEQYREKVELPELQRRKAQLAAIHKRFMENSPDVSELDMRQRAHQALQRLSGERGHHKLKGRERMWMQTRVWYHGQAKSRVLQQDAEQRTAQQRKQMQLKMQLERKKAYDKWVKRVAPPKLDSDKVGEIQSRVQRLRNPAPRKTERDNARDHRQVGRRGKRLTGKNSDQEGGDVGAALDLMDETGLPLQAPGAGHRRAAGGRGGRVAQAQSMPRAASRSPPPRAPIQQGSHTVAGRPSPSKGREAGPLGSSGSSSRVRCVLATACSMRSRR